MIKFLIGLIFLIPLCFLDCFWLIQFIFFVFRFLFSLNFRFNYCYIYISSGLGCDFLSFSLILLRFWICSLMILAREKIFTRGNYENLFLFVMVILIISLYITFSSLNLFIFYLFFEIRLIPTLILIIGWGYQPERIEAGIYMLFYTLFISLPIIIALFFYYINFYTLEFILINNNLNIYMFICINMIFIVKIPMFFIHL